MADFLPLQSLGVIQSSLPLELTSFVGCKHELGRLLTLVIVSVLMYACDPRLAHVVFFA